jgi:hypothetical protein
MTSEIKFSTGFSSVWKEIMPLSDGFWSVENMLTHRVAAPITNKAPKHIRGLVNELAFIAFTRLANSGKKASREDVSKTISESISEAITYINRVNPTEIASSKLIDETCIREATLITLRLLAFFPLGKPKTLRPKFIGCGFINACEGDVIFNDHLFEVKAGDRTFRVSDLRQLLTYSALAHTSGNLNFTKIGLFNPRTGLSWSKSIDDVCLAISGLRANDVLPKIVDHMLVEAISR